VSPHGLVAARFALAALFLLAIFPRSLARLDRPTLRAGLGAGAVLWAAFAFQTLGLVHTTPSKSAFVTATYVPMTPLLGRLLFGTRITRPVLVSAGLAFAGLALLTHPADLAAVNRGDLLTLASAAGFALHILVLDRVAMRLRARPLAILQLGATAAIAWPVALAVEGAPTQAAGEALPAIVYLALVCSALAYLAQTWAQRHTSPARVAVIFSLESVFAALFAALLLGERLTAGEWLGGVLIVAGLWIGQRPRLARAERAARAGSGPGSGASSGDSPGEFASSEDLRPESN
jgi:drug/metabolite transporter (DMT)-like permease